MANYYECSIRDVTSPDLVGVGVGEVDGQDRICISLEGPRVNATLASEWNDVNWTALSPACAKALFGQLELLRHLWE